MISRELYERNMKIKETYKKIKPSMKQFDAFDQLGNEYNLDVTTIQKIVFGRTQEVRQDDQGHKVQNSSR